MDRQFVFHITLLYTVKLYISIVMTGTCMLTEAMPMQFQHGLIVGMIIITLTDFITVLIIPMVITHMHSMAGDHHFQDGALVCMDTITASIQGTTFMTHGITTANFITNQTITLDPAIMYPVPVRTATLLLGRVQLMKEVFVVKQELRVT